LEGGRVTMVSKVLLSLMTFLTALTFLLSLLAIFFGAIPSQNQRTIFSFSSTSNSLALGMME
jgi:hypothetical protein